MTVNRCVYLLCLSVVFPESFAAGEERVDAAGQPSLSACVECDAVLTRVLKLLPRRPEQIVVVDAERATKLLRSSTEDVEGFVMTGDHMVYLNKQGPTFQLALKAPGVWDYALAIIVWHEMAHVEGTDEREARRREEELWSRFILAGLVDSERGLAYLTLLRKRPQPRIQLRHEPLLTERGIGRD